MLDRFIINLKWFPSSTHRLQSVAVASKNPHQYSSSAHLALVCSLSGSNDSLGNSLMDDLYELILLSMFSSSWIFSNPLKIVFVENTLTSSWIKDRLHQGNQLAKNHCADVSMWLENGVDKCVNFVQRTHLNGFSGWLRPGKPTRWSTFSYCKQELMWPVCFLSVRHRHIFPFFGLYGWFLFPIRLLSHLLHKLYFGKNVTEKHGSKSILSPSVVDNNGQQPCRSSCYLHTQYLPLLLGCRSAPEYIVKRQLTQFEAHKIALFVPLLQQSECLVAHK